MEKEKKDEKEKEKGVLIDDSEWFAFAAKIEQQAKPDAAPPRR